MKQNLLTVIALGICLTTYGQQINENSLSRPQKGLFDYFKRGQNLLADTSDGGFEPNLSSLGLSVDLLARPEDFSAGNFLSPKGTGNYSETLWGIKDKTAKTFRGMYEINLEIQSPSTTNDTSATLNRILSSGGVGNISGVIKSGFFGSENKRGVTLSVIPAFSWQNSKQLKDTTTNSFAFGSIKGSLSLWTGPILITVQGSYNYVLGNADELIAKSINKKLIWTGMIALKISKDYYFQFKALIPESSFKNEMMEFSIVKTIKL